MTERPLISIVVRTASRVTERKQASLETDVRKASFCNTLLAVNDVLIVGSEFMLSLRTR